MKRTISILCAAFLTLFLASEVSAQTHQQLVESTKKNLAEVVANLGGVDCGEDKERPCPTGQDRDELLAKKQYLEDYLDELTLTGGDPDDDVSNDLSAPTGNPTVAETHEKLLAQAEAQLIELKKDPKANAGKIRVMEARVSSLKSRIN